PAPPTGGPASRCAADDSERETAAVLLGGLVRGRQRRAPGGDRAPVCLVLLGPERVSDVFPASSEVRDRDCRLVRVQTPPRDILRGRGARDEPVLPMSVEPSRAPSGRRPLRRWAARVAAINVAILMIISLGY